MTSKELILSKIANSIDDKLLIAKILDKAKKSEYAQVQVSSDFLDPGRISLVEKALSFCNDVNYTVYGGYIGAERKAVIFYPEFMEDSIDYSDIFYNLSIKPKNMGNMNHRDFLGSLLGLGIKREKIGDILVKEDHCNVIVMADICDYIKFNLEKVGNTGVEVDTCDLEELQFFEPKLRDIKATVASLRLDSVAGAGFGLSRSKIADLIKGDKVNLNWQTTDNVSKMIKQGDIISIKGKGRIVVENIGGVTKKGRISVLIKKFI